MIPDDLLGQLVEAFRREGQALGASIERRITALPRGDVSGWYYINTVETDTDDGRKQATLKAKNEAVGPSNPALGPLPCLRSYTPVVGHRVLVRWVAGSRADGVIEG